MTTIANDLKLVAYPGFGHRTRRGSWCLRISGCVYDYSAEIPVRKRLLVKMLAKAMKATQNDLNSECFRRRIAPFVAKSGRGHRIMMRVGDRTYALRRKSRRSGLFRGKIVLEAAMVDHLIKPQAADGSYIPATLWLDHNASHRVQMPILMLADQGVSVVSDIDDTIKETQIGNRRELLANTFLREYRAVPGMAKVYRGWAEQGASFHYVSSSPWQLYESLFDFKSLGGFPEGTIDLRVFRFRDEFVRRRSKTRKRKCRSIRLLMQAYPNRRFVLIGDSGERDPEIYAQLARRFPQQIAAILIRDLENVPLTDKRRAKLADVANCRFFVNADELIKSIAPWQSSFAK